MRTVVVAAVLCVWGTVQAEKVVRSVAISADGALVAGIVEEHNKGEQYQGDKLMVWDLKSPKSKVLAVVERITQIKFAPNDHTIGYAAQKPVGPVTLINGDTGKVVRVLNEAGHSFAFSPDGKTLGSESDDDLKLWDLATGAIVERRSGGTGMNNPMILRNDRTIHFMDSSLSISKPGQRFPEKWPFASHDLSLSPDGKYLAIYDNGLILVDTSSGKAVAKTEPFETDKERGERGDQWTFAPDGKAIAFVFDRAIVWFSVPDLRVASTWKKDLHGAQSVAISRDGKNVAIALENCVRVIDGTSADGKLIVQLEP